VGDRVRSIRGLDHGPIPYIIEDYFRTNYNLAVDPQGRLHICNAGEPSKAVLPEHFVRELSPVAVDKRLIEAFASDVYERLAMTLSALPPGTRLSYDDFSKASYSTVAVHYDGLHSDGFDNLLMHFSDPGTPFPLGADMYRSAAGDVTLHGMSFDHGHATAVGSGGEIMPRLCLAFKVFYDVPIVSG
jgi:hypothetical protein